MSPFPPLSIALSGEAVSIRYFWNPPRFCRCHPLWGPLSPGEGWEDVRGVLYYDSNVVVMDGVCVFCGADGMVRTWWVLPVF